MLRRCVCVLSQVALKDRSPTQVNAALATRKPVPEEVADSTKPPPAINLSRPPKRNERNTRKRDASKQPQSSRTNVDDSEGDPYANNYALAGVGRGTLNKLTVEKLMAAALARNIPNASKLDKPRLAARLEAWKRELAISSRNGPIDLDEWTDDNPRPNDNPRDDDKPRNDPPIDNPEREVQQVDSPRPPRRAQPACPPPH